MLLLIFFLRTSQERYNTVLYLLIGSALAMFTFVLIVITHDEFRLVWFLLLSFSAFMFGGKRVGQVSTLLSFVIIVATYNFFELGISATALVAALISLIIGAIIINSYTSTMDRFAIALDDAKEEAEAMAHVKAEFLAAMSHEIRTPMNGVIGMLGLLINSKLSDTQQHQAYVAQSSANSLLTLINDILDFSKVDAGHLELENLDFNLRNQLGDFADGIALKAEEKGVELILDLTQIQHAMVRSDPGRLRQILTNIVGNAIKFTHEGEILIKAALDIQSNQTARVRISVSDTGVGIPKDKIETLFDTFTQVDASTTRKYGGTGLGLAIAKKLVYLMKGDISVQSTLGKGSTFTFDIEVGLSEDRS
ncbi:MAG: ATP-binding protein, partial [Thiovulaceae bacterium]|nr:ATP-binding protein [Sulfurimonadaceae bacterium]